MPILCAAMQQAAAAERERIIRLIKNFPGEGLANTTKLIEGIRALAATP